MPANDPADIIVNSLDNILKHMIDDAIDSNKIGKKQVATIFKVLSLIFPADLPKTRRKFTEGKKIEKKIIYLKE